MNIDGSNQVLAVKLQELLQAKMDAAGTAASAAFIQNGELISACAVGTQDGDKEKPATVYDLYNVGSVSKIYCTLAILKLQEMGKVALDEPVCKYLPRFKMLDERYKQITLRMCLSHSSGLPGTDMKNSFCSMWLGEEFTEHFFDYLSKSKLKADPGRFSVYCNDGFTLAELVVAEVSGLSFTRFVQEQITFPLGAVSACSGENNPAERVRIAEKDKTVELLTVVGSGGISTDLTDCARLGYMFIEPQGLFQQESLAETAALQAASFLPAEISPNFGLGWDRVNLQSDRFNFGDGVLLKSGGTLSFLSHLIVIPKYKLAAAISVTQDAKIDTLTTLCEMCALLLDDAGINTWKNPVPQGWKDRFEGTYYGNSIILRVEITPDQLNLKIMGAKGWTDRERGLGYENGYFVSGKNKYYFHEHGDTVYLVFSTPLNSSPLAQKFSSFPEVSQAWRERDGKKYLIKDGHPGDLIFSNVCGLIVCAPFEEGPLVFRSSLASTPRLTPALPQGDNETEMFLDSPGNASRDCFAPFFWVEDGAEHVYFSGYTMVESSSLNYLDSGSIISDQAQQNAVYRLATGKKLQLEKPDEVRILLADEELVIYYDSQSSVEMPESKEGYIIFLNSAAMNFPVKVL